MYELFFFFACLLINIYFPFSPLDDDDCCIVDVEPNPQATHIAGSGPVPAQLWKRTGLHHLEFISYDFFKFIPKELSESIFNIFLFLSCGMIYFPS